MEGKHPMTAFLLLLYFFSSLAGCTKDRFYENDLGDSYRAGFAAQVVHPNHPLPGDRVDGESGDLVRKIHEQRYVPAITKDQDDDGDEKLSRQLR